MAQAVEGLVVVGSALDEVEACTRPVVDGETLTIGAMTVACLATPGHTKGSMCFSVTCEGADAPAVFTGDTLFVGGCGRLFEGEAEDLWPAIEAKLLPLPPETRVYCGHEYTVTNLSFGASTTVLTNWAVQMACLYLSIWQRPLVSTPCSCGSVDGRQSSLVVRWVTYRDCSQR